MATYFVDWKKGSDDNDGSMPDQALKTNTKVLELASEGDTVLVQMLAPPPTRYVVENGELKAVDNG